MMLHNTRISNTGQATERPGRGHALDRVAKPMTTVRTDDTDGKKSTDTDRPQPTEHDLGVDDLEGGE